MIAAKPNLVRLTVSIARLYYVLFYRTFISIRVLCVPRLDLLPVRHANECMCRCERALLLTDVAPLGFQYAAADVKSGIVGGMLSQLGRRRKKLTLINTSFAGLPPPPMYGLCCASNTE